MVVLSYIVIYKEYSFSTVHQFDRSAAKQNAEQKLKKDLALVSHFVSRKSSSSDSAAFQNQTSNKLINPLKGDAITA